MERIEHRAPAAIDAGPGLDALDQPQLAPDERGERARPGADDQAPVDVASVEDGGHGLAELDLALGDAAVGEAERERRIGLVPAHGDLLERAELLAVQQPAALADDVEAPVLEHAERLELDRVALLERHSLHGGDVDPGDPAGHAPSLAGVYMVQRPHR